MVKRKTPPKDMKKIWLEVFDKMGGIEGLLFWANENQNEFYKICTKLFSVELKDKDEKPNQVLVKFLEDKKLN